MRRLRAAHAAVALSPRQFQLLGLLHDGGPTGQRELGELMRVDPSILVALLNDLESEGYATRERDSTDRRRHVVTITAAGRRRLERAARTQRETEHELFAGLDATQWGELERLLVALRDSLADEPSCG